MCQHNLNLLLFFLFQTKLLLYGNLLVMRPTMESHKNVCMDILTSSVMLFFHPMETTLCLDHGIKLYVSGIWLLEKLLVVLKIILRSGLKVVLFKKKNLKYFWVNLKEPLRGRKICLLKIKLIKRAFARQKT